MGGVWLMRETGSSQPAANNTGMMVGRSLSPNIQPPGITGQSVLGGQRMPQPPLVSIPSHPLNGSNFTFRPPPPSGQTPVASKPSQPLQDSPDIKKARTAFMEAQKKSAAAMRKAQAAQNKQEPASNVPKSIPLTIQMSSASLGSNGVVQVKAK